MSAVGFSFRPNKRFNRISRVSCWTKNLSCVKLFRHQIYMGRLDD